MAKYPHDKTRPASQGVRKALAKGDMKALALALTPRQRAFCQEYVVDFNATASAIRAGYSLNYPDRQGAALMMNPGIKEYINHLTTSKEAKITAINPDYVIQKVTEIISKEGTKDGDTLRALELLARHLGMFIDRTEITGKDGGAIELEQRKVEEEAENFMNAMEFLRKKALASQDDTKKKEVHLT